MRHTRPLRQHAYSSALLQPSLTEAPDSRNAHDRRRHARARVAERTTPRRCEAICSRSQPAIAETYLQTAARLKETTRALEAPVAMPMAAETSGQAHRCANANGAAMAIARAVDDPQRSDLRSEPRQRLRTGRGDRRRPANPAQVLCGAATRRRVGELRPGCELGATHRLCRDTTQSARSPIDPEQPEHRSIAGRAKETGGGGSGPACCGRPTAARRGPRGARAPFVGQGFYDLAGRSHRQQRLVAGTNGGLYVSTDGGATWTRGRCSNLVGRHRTWAGSDSGDAGRVLGWRLIAPPTAARRGPPSRSRAHRRHSIGWRSRLLRQTQRSRTPGAQAAAQLTSIAVPRGTWTAMRCPRAEHGPGLVRLVSRGGAGSGHSGVLRCDRELSRRPVGHDLDLDEPQQQRRPGDSIHPDQHAIAFEPGTPTRFTSAMMADCSAAPTAASTGSALQQRPGDLRSSSTWPRIRVVSVADRRAHRTTAPQRWTGAPTWTHVADGDGGDCGVNRTNPRTVFHTYFGMSPERSTTGGDFGSWAGIQPPVPAGEGSAFYPPFECSASGGDTIAIGGDAVYVSRNNGTNWIRLAYPAAARSSAMYIPNSDTVYVGTSDGRIFRTTWKVRLGRRLSALTQPRAAATVSDIKVDPSNGQRVWATYSTTGGGRVFRSDDGGSHWTGSDGRPAQRSRSTLSRSIT